MAKKNRGFFVYLISMAAIGALTLLSLVPFNILTAVGAWLGGVYFHLDRRRKKIGLDNLRLALGKTRTEHELKALLKSVYRNMGSSLMEFAAIPRMSKEEIRKRVRMEGLKYIKQTQREGRGIVLFTAHAGNWELYAQSLPAYGFPVHGIGREANVKRLHDFIVRCRESHGNRVIVRDNAIRKILKALKKGDIVGILGDQRGSTSRGLMVDLFDHPAPTNPALAKMFLKSGAAVMTCFGFRNSDQTHTFTINEPIQFIPTQDADKDAHQLTQIYMKSLEAFIKEHPDQWLWMHRRWMTRGSKAK